MSAPEPIEEEKPLDPATEKMRKKLVKFSAVFMGINMLALMAVLAAIVYKIGGYGDEPDEAISQASAPIEPGFERMLDVPDGTTVLNASENDGNITLNLTLPNGEKEIWLYSISEGQIKGKLSIR